MEKIVWTKTKETSIHEYKDNCYVYYLFSNTSRGNGQWCIIEKKLRDAKPIWPDHTRYADFGRDVKGDDGLILAKVLAEKTIIQWRKENLNGNIQSLGMETLEK